MIEAEPTPKPDPKAKQKSKELDYKIDSFEFPIVQLQSNNLIITTPSAIALDVPLKSENRN